MCLCSIWKGHENPLTRGELGASVLGFGRIRALSSEIFEARSSSIIILWSGYFDWLNFVWFAALKRINTLCEQMSKNYGGMYQECAQITTHFNIH